jgi:hypothetical protein
MRRSRGMELWELIEVLEKSVEKNGKDYPLTLGHLLNILKKMEREQDDECDATEWDIY